MRGQKIIVGLLIVLFTLILLPTNALAVDYELIGPTETLTMGQSVQFTININTQGQSLTQAQIGMTYDTQYLQFLNTLPGDTFPTINFTPLEGGKVLITANSSTGYSGSGVFAYVNFKIIAGSPGSTEICTLWAPTPTTPVAPTSVLQATPTILPRSGENKPVVYVGLLGSLFLLPTLGFFVIHQSKSLFKDKKTTQRSKSS